MERTVVKNTICRKKSDKRPTTANRQNSCKETHDKTYNQDHDTITGKVIPKYTLYAQKCHGTALTEPFQKVLNLH